MSGSIRRGLLPEEKGDGSFSDSAVRSISNLLLHAEERSAAVLRAEQDPANRHQAVLSRHFSDADLRAAFRMAPGGDDQSRVEEVVANLLLFDDTEERRVRKVSLLLQFYPCPRPPLLPYSLPPSFLYLRSESRE